MKKIIFIFIFIIGVLWPIIRYSYQYDESVIRFGMSGPMSGDLKELGQNFFKGSDAFFKDLNEKGGVNGREIKLLVKDDKYEPKIAVENVKEFIQKDKVFALFGVIGTPVSKAVLPLALDKGVPYLAALSGAKFLRKPRNAMILNVRKGYRSEIDSLLNYYVDTMQYKRIGVFYQNDSFGHIGIKFLKELLRKRNLEIVGEGSYKRNTLAVGHAIYELSSESPDAIILISATKPAVEFIRRAREDKFLKDKNFGLLSFSGAEAVVDSLEKNTKNLLFSQVVPLPWGNSPDVKEYRRQMEKYYPDTNIGFVSLEGYFAAKMVTSVFNKVGYSFSKDSFIDALHDIPKEIFQDRSIVIKDNSCGCLDKIYLTRYKKNKFELVGSLYE